MREKVEQFVKYAASLDGDEKGEAQVFCDRFFKAFGHEGYKEAGATMEFRVKGKKNTRFADLLWGDRVLIEMKKKGAQLQSHRTQVFDYWWKLRPNQPKYSILCNFNEFIIYDFAIQDEPLDRIKVEELPDRYTAFNFMLPKPATPVFHNNLEEVTRETAALVAKAFNSLIARGEDRERSQRFILQCIFSMFAEDYQLLPKDILTSILLDCHRGLGNAYDLIGALFSQMNSREQARGGRFKDVQYFNGGLFAKPEPIEPTDAEIKMLLDASGKLWNKVNPAIFGTIFQSSMGEEARHAFGAHFTTELDILKIVHPTIIQPWREKIAKAKTLTDMKQLRKEIAAYKVLDPACGSGNFLYVAFRELKRVEMELLNKIHTEFPKSAAEIGTQSIVSIKQFFGLDYNHFAVELAKVTLMLAKEVAIKETRDWVDTMQIGLGFQMEETLPLDNMDNNIVFADALFTDWPEADVIIGNPPYQSKNKMQEEYGPEYVAKVREVYPEVPGRADYCVYWFHLAHKQLNDGGYAGLVGTNTIRQNYSREGSLDYIVKNGGTIFNAISSQPWSGDAVVFVSIVNWAKGDYKNKKQLFIENEKGDLEEYLLDEIHSSLSLQIDVTEAKVLECNRKPKVVFQGQTHGYDGFLLSKEEAREILKKNDHYEAHLFPYLIGQELVGIFHSQPSRYVIDFSFVDDVNELVAKKELYEIIREKVYPSVEEKAIAEKEGKIKKNGREQHLNYWWKMWRRREDMLAAKSNLTRYIACSRVSSRPIFEFVSADISPNDALMVFAFEDDYTFGIIQSQAHVLWYQEKCSSMKGDPRYTPNTIWDTFPFPQNPKPVDVKKVAVAAQDLRDKRNEVMNKHNYTLRDIYRILEEPGANPLKDTHQKLDDAVLAAYGFGKRKDLLTQLLALNLEVAEKIQKGEEVQSPGLPKCVENRKEFMSEDCVKME